MKAPFYDKRTWLRLAFKVLAILIAANVLYIVVQPYDRLASSSIVGWVVPLRQRLVLPAREEQAQLGALEMLLNAHEISQPKTPDEFRVVLLGDSGINGWGLNDDETINTFLNTMRIDAKGRKVRAYNLGYVGFSLSRDLLIADASLAYKPDLIVLFVTQKTFVDAGPDRLLAYNQPLMTRLTTEFQLDDQSAQVYGHYQDSWWAHTLFAQRDNFFQWINFQSYALRQSQFYANDFNLIRDHMGDQYLVDPEAPKSIRMPNADWLPLKALSQLSNVPALIVNEPIFIAPGSVFTYDSFYGRTLYDQYRAAFNAYCSDNRLWCLDLWNSLPQTDFSDSPVHHTPQGNQLLASQVADEIERKIGSR